MAKRGETRGRILDIAEAAVLAKGFGATSIDEIIAEAGITRSGFFYHFRDKNALALALLERHIARDEEVLDGVFRRAEELTDDPLQACLVGMKLFAEMLAAMETVHPGCLVATYCYQERLFDREVRELNRKAVLNWRERFRAMFEAINRTRTPRDGVDAEALADMVSVVVEGGIVLSKALREEGLLPRQVLLLRSYVKLLYDEPAQAARAA
jgi:AcrR family transcriptional regulator